MRLLVSACLLGVCCRYDGCGKENAAVTALSEKCEVVPVCPEQLGGLPTPRIPCERSGDSVIAADGSNRTEAYLRGAEEAFKLYRLTGCDAALLKARSPMCGRDSVYDGTFSRKLIPGSGVLAEKLLQNGIRVYTEEDLPGEIST